MRARGWLELGALMTIVSQAANRNLQPAQRLSRGRLAIGLEAPTVSQAQFARLPNTQIKRRARATKILGAQVD